MTDPGGHRGGTEGPRGRGAGNLRQERELRRQRSLSLLIETRVEVFLTDPAAACVRACVRVCVEGR